jgi:hypothetical protein
LKLVGARGFVKNWPIRGSESTCTFLLGFVNELITICIFVKIPYWTSLYLQFFYKNVHLCVAARRLDGVNNLHCVQLT